MDSSENDITNIQSLVKQLSGQLDGLTELNPSDRNTALQTMEQLKDALELPQTAAVLHSFSHIHQACTQTALDLGIFNVLIEDGEKPKTVTELAEKCGADSLLMLRIMRVLAAQGFAKEEGEGTYSSTSKGRAMSKPIIKIAMAHQFNVNIHNSWRTPEYFKSAGYRNPDSKTRVPFQFAKDTDESYFKWMQQRPAIMSNFNAFMQGVRLDRSNWIDWFPVKQETIDRARDGKDEVFMIDVGGGRGHDLAAFRDKFPEAPGRFMLQDQQHVIDEVSYNSIEKMSYDFFTPQPVKGAQVYFMHYILHDWDDDNCIEILKNTASAMTKGYSKLYLNEWILPDVGCSLYEASIDINMMINFGGMERSKGQWQELLTRSGLKLEKFWQNPGFGEGIVEASL